MPTWKYLTLIRFAIFCYSGIPYRKHFMSERREFYKKKIKNINLAAIQWYTHTSAGPDEIFVIAPDILIQWKVLFRFLGTKYAAVKRKSMELKNRTMFSVSQCHPHTRNLSYFFRVSLIIYNFPIWLNI